MKNTPLNMVELAHSLAGMPYKKEIYMKKETEYYSNCCNAFMGPYFEDTLICPECKEHCGIEEKCSECDGTGIRENSKDQECECIHCDGNGFTEVSSG